MTPAKFTRGNPCTKVHLCNCFFDPDKNGQVSVVEAHSVVGLHAPKYMLDRGYLLTKTEKGVDYYVLTAFGRNWLQKGVLRHLELHPENAKDLRVSVSPESRRPSRVVRRR